jgi:molybdenum-dependent DNA-binding transcriptional regulator ModE
LDWDRIRIFYSVAEAGSFTRAGDDLGLSQSAVSRQISALERELKAPLFHRHARGLILTEQGDLLLRAARDMRMRLETTRARLVETSERPSGDLKVTTTVGSAPSGWRSASPNSWSSIRMCAGGADPVQRVSWTSPCARPTWRSACAARSAEPYPAAPVHGAFPRLRLEDYIKRFGEPKTLEDLDDQRIFSSAATSPPISGGPLALTGGPESGSRPLHSW